MSALSRLLARAGGQQGVAQTLRPRLPSRFEGTVGEASDGFETVTETERAMPAAPAEAGPAPSVQAPRSAPSPGSLDRAGRAERMPSTSNIEQAAPEVGAIQRDTTPPPSLLAAERAALPEPRTPSVSASTPLPPENPHRPAFRETDSAPLSGPAAPVSAARNLDPLPQRLQPPASPPKQQATHLARTTNAAPRAAAPRTPAPVAPPQPPEITVHIGRLHVVTEAPRSRPPQERAQPRRASAALGAYLSGKEEGA